jgi:hypothetical protein
VLRRDGDLAPHIEWIQGEVDLTADMILQGATEGSELSKARSFLERLFEDSDGKRIAKKQIVVAAKERGIKERTLERAKKELNLDHSKVDRVTYWQPITELSPEEIDHVLGNDVRFMS